MRAFHRRIDGGDRSADIQRILAGPLGGPFCGPRPGSGQARVARLGILLGEDIRGNFDQVGFELAAFHSMKTHAILRPKAQATLSRSYISRSAACPRINAMCTILT